MKKLTAIDLFSGCGGLSEGLKAAGFRVLAAVERDSLAVKTYKANHKRVRVIHDDIRGVKAAALRKSLRLPIGQLDLLAGCPPCQGFSSLRTRNGSAKNRDARNNLIREMLRFARAFKPRAIMMENVPGLALHTSFKKMCRDLKKLGYQVVWDIKDAKYYGVPQRRKRLILMAGLGFTIPLASEAPSLVTVRSAIGKLSQPGKSRDALQNLSEDRSPRIMKIIRSIPRDGGSRSDLPKLY